MDLTTGAAATAAQAAAPAAAPDKPINPMADAFAAIDAIQDTQKSQPKAPDAPPAAPATPAKTDAAPPKDEPKADTKPVDDLDSLRRKPKAADKKEDPKPDTKPEDEKFKYAPRELREQAQRLKEENEELRRKMEQAIKADPDEIQRIRKEYDEEKSKLTAQLQQIDTELKFRNYRASNEFKQKFEQPLKDQYKLAMEDLEGVKIKEGEAERDIEISDIVQLTRLPAVQARQVAKQLFGENADIAMTRYNEIRKINRESEQAIEEWKTKGAEREQQTERERIQQMESARTLFTSELDGLVKNYADLFAPGDSDDEKQAFAKGQQLTRQAFMGQFPESMPKEERLKIQARAAAKAQAFDVMTLRHNRLLDRVEELENELKGYKTADPKPGGGGRDDQKTSSVSWEQKIDALPAV